MLQLELMPAKLNIKPTKIFEDLKAIVVKYAKLFPVLLMIIK
jgi:hypothetical protein